MVPWSFQPVLVFPLWRGWWIFYLLRRARLLQQPPVVVDHHALDCSGLLLRVRDILLVAGTK